MIKSTVQALLDENISKDVISTREQSGKTLSYLETWYVIDRLNQVLGQGNWGYSLQNLNKVFEGEIEQYSGKAFSTSYIATVLLQVTVDGKFGCMFTEVGYGDGTDKKNPGKAHELATKGAVSDALKRAAKNLGRSMGLALYDKTQEYVSENISQTGSTGTVSNTDKPTGPILRTEPVAAESAITRRTSMDEQSTKTEAVSKRPVKELITAKFKVLEAQKKITKEEFKEKYQKGAGLSTLSEPTLQFILKSLETDFPHLNGSK